MKLQFTYEQDMGWVEAPAIHSQRSYVYWLSGNFVELDELTVKSNLRKVPIGTNPFKKEST